MNISELYSLATWIQNEVAGDKIQNPYVNLHSLLHQNTQPNQAKQPLAELQEKLLEAVSEAPVHQLSSEQMKVLQELEIKDLLGAEGIRFIDETLRSNDIDPATAAQKFKEAVRRMKSAINQANTLKETLNPYVPEEYEHPENKYQMRVTFAGESDLQNFVDMKKWSQSWVTIARGITMAIDKAPEDIEILGASRGSVILDLLAEYEVIEVISEIVRVCFETTIAVQLIRLQAQEIRKNNRELKNDHMNKAADEMDVAADKEQEKRIKKIVKDVTKNLKINTETQSDKIKPLTKSIEELVKFFNNDGNVDFISPPVDDIEEETETGEIKKLSPKEKKLLTQRTKITNKFEEIRKLKQRTLELEFRDNN